MRTPVLLAVITVAARLPAMAEGTIRAVAADGSADFTTVQAAIDAAASGDTLHLAAGTYEEHLVLLGKELLIEGLLGAEATILDGQFTGRVLTVVSAPGPVILRGLTVQNGVRDGIETGNQGGGVAAFLTDLVVEDCVVRMNIASALGAGISVGTFIPAGEPTAPYAGGTPALRVTGTLFEENLCGGAGGAIHCDEVPSTVVDCVFQGNHAGETGGGIDLLQRDHRIERCRFQNNSGFLGAGAAMSGSGVLTLSEVVFYSNVAGNFGGGLWCTNGGGLTAERVVFRQNFADRGGGAYLSRVPVSATRVLWSGNQATERGGALHLDQVESAWLDHSTWLGNAAPLGASLWAFAGSLTITYSIVGDEDPEAAACFGGTAVDGSCTVGGLITGDCLPFTARRSIEPCPIDPDLLCEIPAPGACGPVGHTEAACTAPGCSTPARVATWGALKARYRP